MIRPKFKLPLLLAVLFILQSVFWLSAGWAYEPSIKEIIARSLKDKVYFSRAIIETQSSVFDPFSTDRGAHGTEGSSVRTPGVGADETVPLLQEDRGFTQITYWVRNKLLAVETFSMEGELLHFYLREALKPVSVNLTKSRIFSDDDVLSAYLPFIEGNRGDWEAGLARWGLRPATAKLVRASKGRVYYQLSESPGKSLWMDRIRYLPVRINTLVEGDPRPLVITVEFSEFVVIEGRKEQVFVFPRTINHLLDGTLFKQTTITSIRVNPSWRIFPLTRLRRKARELVLKTAEAHPVSGIK